jgi:hypothetical protein
MTRFYIFVICFICIFSTLNAFSCPIVQGYSSLNQSLNPFYNDGTLFEDEYLAAFWTWSQALAVADVGLINSWEVNSLENARVKLTYSGGGVDFPRSSRHFLGYN